MLHAPSLNGSARARPWAGRLTAGREWTGRLKRAYAALADVVLIVLIGLIASAWLISDRSAGPSAWLLEAALLLPLLFRRRAPVVALSVLVGVASVQWLVGVELVADVSVLVALYTVAAQCSRRITLAAVATVEIGAAMAAVRWTLTGDQLRSFVFLSGLVAAAVALGNNQRTRRAYEATLIERAERLEHERDQQTQLAAVAERTRIAREMHDVIAHSLAVIVALADGATAKLRSDPERAGRAIRDVSEVGRQALGDTRRLLGVLRTDQASDTFSPQPGIAGLPELLSQVRATGLAGQLAIDGESFPLPPGAELTAYRIVQEAITNTLKHASGATTVSVRLTYGKPDLRILVTDDGHGSAPVTGGHGLAGMSERVAAYGGSVAAGPGPGGGWSVHATLRLNGETP